MRDVPLVEQEGSNFIRLCSQGLRPSLSIPGFSPIMKNILLLILMSC